MTTPIQQHAIHLVYQYHLGSIDYPTFHLRWSKFSWQHDFPLLWNVELLMFQFEDNAITEAELRNKLFDMVEEVEA